MGTSTPHAKKNDGSRARFGRDLSSTVQCYDLILEICMYSKSNMGNFALCGSKDGHKYSLCKKNRW
jgi:hypothetical protein